MEFYGGATNLAVVDHSKEVVVSCEWLGFGESDWNSSPKYTVSVCCTWSTKADNLVVTEGQSYESSLSANYKFIDGKNVPENLKLIQSKDGVDVFRDKSTGEKFFVRREYD